MSGCFLEDGAELMRNEYVLLTPLFSVLTAITICGFVMNRYLREEALAKYVLHHTDNVLVTQFKELEDALGERRDVEQERNRLSAQDNYAQWTKLNRRVEKLNEKVDVLSREMETYRRGRIDQYRRWIKYAVHGPQYFVKLWFANRPVLYWRGGFDNVQQLAHLDDGVPLGGEGLCDGYVLDRGIRTALDGACVVQ